LELYYPTAHAFTDQDVHTCQLMAGLVTIGFTVGQASQRPAGGGAAR
jgi:hypothetical protein